MKERNKAPVLVNAWVDMFSSLRKGFVLRLDFDNDTHHAIVLGSKNEAIPEEIATHLREAANEIVRFHERPYVRDE